MSGCFVCDRKVQAQFPFCRYHYQDYKDQLKEPWVKALKYETQREERALAQAAARVVSLEWLEERMLAEEERRAK